MYIKKYPYKIDSISTLFEYVKNESSNKKDILYYAPYIFSRMELKELLNESKIINNNSNEKQAILRFFSYSAILRQINNNTIANLKKTTASLIAQITQHGVNDVLTEKLIEMYNGYLKVLTTYKEEEKLLESAMTNFSPIVPYNGYIRKPIIDNTFKWTSEQQKSSIGSRSSLKNNEIINHKINTIEISRFNNHELVDVLDILKERSHTTSGLDDYLYNIMIMNVIDILEGSDLWFIYSPSNLINENLSEIVDFYLKYSESGKMNIIQVYFLLSFINKNIKSEDFPKIYDLLYRLTNLIDNIAIDKSTLDEFGNVLESIEYNKIYDINSISAFESAMNYDMDKLVIPSDIETRIHYNEITQPGFDIEKLMAYLHLNKKYTSNRYNNILFENHFGHNIREIMDYNEYTLYELKDDTLCVCVTDITDNYRIKIIIMNNGNKISVTYMNECIEEEWNNAKKGDN